MMKTSLILTLIGLFIGSLALVWWYRGEQKDKEHASAAQHYVRTDTLYVDKIVPMNHFHGTVADKKPDSSTYRAIEDAFYAGWDKGADSAKAAFIHIATPVDTNIVRTNIGSEWIYYNPLTRMLIADLQLLPVKEMQINKVDSVIVPLYIHDTFWQRASYVGTGTLIGYIMFTLTK